MSCNLFNKNKMVCRFCYLCYLCYLYFTSGNSHPSCEEKAEETGYFVHYATVALIISTRDSLDRRESRFDSPSQRPPCIIIARSRSELFRIRSAFSFPFGDCFAMRLRDFNAGFFAARINPRHLIVYAAIKGDPI